MSRVLTYPPGVRPPQGPRVSHTLTPDEIGTLQEVCVWWRERKRSTCAIPKCKTHRTRRTYWIEDALHAAVKEQADREHVSQAELVNLALQRYIEGT